MHTILGKDVDDGRREKVWFCLSLTLGLGFMNIARFFRQLHTNSDGF